MISDSHDENNFLHKLLITDTQVSRIRKVFANGSSTTMKFPKNQPSKMVEGLLGGTFGPLLKTGLHLIRNVLKQLGKCILIPLRSTKNSISNRCCYSKENVWIRYDNINNLE